jgi:hypothetical protein
MTAVTPLRAAMVALPPGVAIPRHLQGDQLLRMAATYVATSAVLPVSDGGRLVGMLPLAAVLTGP